MFFFKIGETNCPTIQSLSEVDKLKSKNGNNTDSWSCQRAFAVALLPSVEVLRLQNSLAAVKVSSTANQSTEGRLNRGLRYEIPEALIGIEFQWKYSRSR